MKRATPRRRLYAGLEVDAVIRVITEEFGLLSLAAQRLEISRTTLLKYCQNHPTVLAALNAAREGFKDLAERRLYDRVNAGDPWAIQFTLRSLGKDRGYGSDRVAEAPPECMGDSADDAGRPGVILNILPVHPGTMLTADTIRALRVPVLTIDNDDGPASH
jgi:hypothetical protein